MAKLGTSFDPTQHDTEQRDYTNLPDGDYKLEVSAADVKIDGSGTGRKIGLKATYDVLEPEEFKGRKVFDYFNLEHPSAQAQEIGQKQFASLCRALGIDKPVDDTDEIMFIAFTAKIGLGKPSKDKDGNGNPVYPAKNEIKKYFFPDEGAVPAAKAAPVASNDNAKPANDNKAAATTATAPAKRPWGAKK